MSFAVRKIEDPMMPLTSSRTESRRESPRTRLGLASGLVAEGDSTAGASMA
jgi:hypothetical protein